MMTATQAAKKKRVSRQCMNVWLRNGRVPGAKKVGTVWIIPDNFTVTPAKHGRPRKQA